MIGQLTFSTENISLLLFDTIMSTCRITIGHYNDKWPDDSLTTHRTTRWPLQSGQSPWQRKWWWPGSRSVASASTTSGPTCRTSWCWWRHFRYHLDSRRPWCRWGSERGRWTRTGSSCRSSRASDSAGRRGTRHGVKHDSGTRKRNWWDAEISHTSREKCTTWSCEHTCNYTVHNPKSKRIIVCFNRVSCYKLL